MQVVNVYNNFPEWARENIPTLIMWGGYSLILFTYWLLGLPMVLLIAGAFVVQVRSWINFTRAHH